MEFLIGDIIFGLLGRIYLFLRYRNQEKMIQIKDKEFGGSYSNVGKIISLKVFLIIFIMLLLGFLVGAVIGTIRNI